MGNKLTSLPSLGANLRSRERFAEYTALPLYAILDCHNYILNLLSLDAPAGSSQTPSQQRSLLEVNDRVFEELFGHLVRNAEDHYAAFTAVNLVSGDQEDFCNTWEFIAALGCLARGSMRTKFHLIFGMGCPLVERRKYNIHSIEQCIYTLLYGLSHVFDFAIVSKSQLDSFLEVSFATFIQNNPHISRKSHDVPAAEMALFKLAESPIYLTFDEMVQFVEDTHPMMVFVQNINDILNHLHSMPTPNPPAPPLVSVTKGSKRPLPPPVLARKESETSANPLFPTEFNMSMSPPGSALNKREQSTHQALLNFKREYELTFIKRSNNPMWKYDLLSFCSPRWSEELASIDTERAVFALLEKVLLGTQPAVPVVLKDNTAGIISVVLTAAGASKKSRTSRVKSSAAAAGSISRDQPEAPSGSASSSQKNSGTSSSSRSGRLKHAAKASSAVQSRASGIDAVTVRQPELVGIFDLFALFIWIGSNLPTSFTAEADALEAVWKETSGNDSRRGTIIVDKESEHSTLENIPNNAEDPESAETVHMPQANKSIQLKSAYADIIRINAGFEWTAIGEYIASSTIKEMLGSPVLSKKPMLTKSDILPCDHAAYSVFEYIARGHRVVPISTSHRGNKVSQVITAFDVVCYLHANPHEFLGKMMYLPVQNSSFLRKAVTVFASGSLGSAISTMTRRNVDAVLILDDKTRKACGVLTCDCLRYFWYNFKKRSTPTCGDFEELQREFMNNKYQPFDATQAHYSVFSTFVSPLTQCEALGVDLYELEAFLKEGLLPPDAGSPSNRRSQLNRLARSTRIEVKTELVTATDVQYANTDSENEGGKAMSPIVKKKVPSMIMAVRKLTAASAISSMNSPALNAVVVGSGDGAAPPPKPPASSAPTGGARPSFKKPVKKSPAKAKSFKKPETPKVDPNLLRRHQRLGEWFQLLGAILPSDNVMCAVDAMFHTKRTRAFVLSPEGNVVGVVTLGDICRELVRQEFEMKSNYYTSKA